MKLKKIEINLRAKVNPVRERVLGHIKGPYFRDTVTQLLMIPSIFMILTSWILSIHYFKVSEYLVPQRYSSFLGVFMLGQWQTSYLIPLLLTVCFISNLLLGKAFYEKDKFLGYILTASNIFLAIVGMVIIINFGKLIN